MSSISAGKLNSTALVHVGDRTGELVFKTNTTQTALTIDSAQNAVFTGDVSVTGNLTINGTTTSFGDGDKLVLGDGNDFEIYHDGSNSYISDGGTGNLVIDTNGSLIKLASTQTDKTMATFNKDGSVELYHNNSQKLQTSATGVTITGALDADNIPGTLGTEGQVLTVDAGGASASWTDAAGGGEADFVASGAISTGDVVILNTNGTVSVAGADGDLGPSGSLVNYESGGAIFQKAAFDSTNNKIVVIYRDQGNSDYGTAVVGTISGGAITFGTPVVFESSQTSQLAIAYDENAGRFMILFQDQFDSDRIWGRVGTVSGTSISFGTRSAFAFNQPAYTEIVYDANAQKTVAFYADVPGGNTLEASVITISGTSFSVGTEVTVNNAATYTYAPVYDANAQKIVITYRTGSPLTFTSKVGTVSGTSISFGSATTISGVNNSYAHAVYDSTAQKIVVVYRDGNNSNNGYGVVGTVSGTSISFGTPVLFDNTTVERLTAIYNPDQQNITIAYRDTVDTVGTLVNGTVSGTTISFGTPTTFTTDDANYPTIIYDTNANSAAVAFSNLSNSNRGDAILLEPASNVTATNFMGIAAENISDAATGKINILGGINESQSSLNVGSSYFLADNGSLSTTNNGRKVGKATAATKILIDTAMTGSEMNEYLGGLV